MIPPLALRRAIIRLASVGVPFTECSNRDRLAEKLSDRALDVAVAFEGLLSLPKASPTRL